MILKDRKLCHRNVSGFLNRIDNRRFWFFAVSALYLTSSIFWSEIELLKLESFHAFFYDLGAQVSSLNSIAQTHSFTRLLTLVPASKPFTLLISYISIIYPSVWIFLVIQSFNIFKGIPP